jgi:hypothetical protein
MIICWQIYQQHDRQRQHDTQHSIINSLPDCYIVKSLGPTLVAAAALVPRICAVRGSAHPNTIWS